MSSLRDIVGVVGGELAATTTSASMAAHAESSSSFVSSSVIFAVVLATVIGDCGMTLILDADIATTEIALDVFAIGFVETFGGKDLREERMEVDVDVVVAELV